MPDTKLQSDRFKPAMPQIPGIDREELPQGAGSRQRTIALGILAGALAIAGIVFFGMSRHTSHEATNAPPTDDVATTTPPDWNTPPAAPAPGPMTVATIAEMNKPWSAKKFTFVNPFTRESTPSMIIRLPGGTGARAEAYWAFSLNAPYETCQLEYIADVAKIAARFEYKASHPMVAGCDGTIYDPLSLGSAPSGAWVRGEVVHGPGIRPPFSIEIGIRGGSIVAERAE